MAMADRQRKTYNYREAAGRFRQAGMTEAAADSVAKEFDTVLTEHSVKRDEFAKLADTVDRLDTSVRELSAVVTSLKNLVEKMDDRLRNVETKTIPDLRDSLKDDIRDSKDAMKDAIRDSDTRTLRWLVGALVAVLGIVGGTFGSALYYIFTSLSG